MPVSHVLRTCLAIASSMAFPLLAFADGASPPGIITSISRSAAIPTDNMPTASEMWAMWISLPAGKRVEMAEPKIKSRWMDLEVGLTGASVSGSLSGNTSGAECVLFGPAGQEKLTGQGSSFHPGDALACHFGTGTPYWEENRGSDLYSRAQMNIGGPWAPGMYNTTDAYRAAGGEAKALRVDYLAFRKVADELRASGTMIATTRIVTMPPGSRSVATDHYPTLRMVIRGELQWGSLAVDAEAASKPAGMFKLGPFNWVDWTKPQQVVVANQTSQPAELVEWSVRPATVPAP